MVRLVHIAMDLEIIASILTIAMAVLVILLAIDLYLRHIILQRLRDRHQELWKDLGSPSLWMNNSFRNGLETLRFLWGKRRHTVSDPYLQNLMRRERILHVVQGFVLLLGLFLMGLRSSFAERESAHLSIGPDTPSP